MTFCHSCGYELTLGTEKFCPNCGFNLQQKVLAARKDSVSTIVNDTNGDVVGAGITGSGILSAKK